MMDNFDWHSSKLPRLVFVQTVESNFTIWWKFWVLENFVFEFFWCPIYPNFEVSANLNPQLPWFTSGSFLATTNKILDSTCFLFVHVDLSVKWNILEVAGIESRPLASRNLWNSYFHSMQNVTYKIMFIRSKFSTDSCIQWKERSKKKTAAPGFEPTLLGGYY